MCLFDARACDNSEDEVRFNQETVAALPYRHSPDLSHSQITPILHMSTRIFTTSSRSEEPTPSANRQEYQISWKLKPTLLSGSYGCSSIQVLRNLQHHRARLSTSEGVEINPTGRVWGRGKPSRKEHEGNVGEGEMTKGVNKGAE